MGQKETNDGTGRVGHHGAFLIRLAALSAVYSLTGALTLALSNSARGSAVIVYPPAAIALVAVFLGGYRYLPAVFVGSLFLGASAGVSLPATVFAGIGSVGQSALGVAWLRKTRFRPDLCRIRDVSLLVFFGAFVSAAFGATLGAGSLCVVGVPPGPSCASLWLVWWLGDSMAIIVLASALFVWSRPIRLRYKRTSSRLPLMMAASTLVAGAAVLGANYPAGYSSLTYALFPFPVWGAVRFRLQGATLALLIILGLAICATAMGRGPFAHGPFSERLVSLCLYIGVLALTGLYLAAALEKGRRRKDESDLGIEIGDGGHQKSYESDSIPTQEGILPEIGRRKQAEEARERPGIKFRTLFESYPDAVYLVGSKGSLEDANPAAVNLFGFSSKNELLHADITGELYQDPEEREEVLDLLRSTGLVKNHQSTVTTRQGAQIDVHVSATALTDGEGRMMGHHEILRDITEQRILEKQLCHAQKIEAIGQLAGGVAHDFNNLLTAITGFTQLAQRELAENSPAAKELNEVLKLVGNAADLTQKLLAFGRRQPQKRRVVDLNRAIEKTADILKRLIGEDINLQFVAHPQLANVRVDPNQIEQVLFNLVINSRDAMRGGGKLVIETANARLDSDYCKRHVAAKPGPYVMVAVTDTGCGMDEEMQHHIFEPFFSTKTMSHGTGLGLAIVYGIVKGHEGFIWVYSEPGKGTTFKIYLPPADAESEVEQVEQEATLSLQGSETILLVEDDVAVRRVARRALEISGYRVLEAASPGEAQEILSVQADGIDLVLTDVVMPEMDGGALHRMLLETGKSLRILYMSGYAENAVARNGMLASEAPFLAKPFSPYQLTRKVRDVLDDCTGINGRDQDDGE